MRSAAILSACLAIAACSRTQQSPAVDGAAPGPTPVVQRTAIGELPAVDVTSVLAHTKVLSSDEFEGRAPGTRGETLTVRYLIDAFQKIGLKPGNTNGTFIQKVPLVGTRSEPSPLVVKGGERQVELKPGDDMVAVSRRGTVDIRIDDAEIVFVGYGIEAPEYQWDDFKGLDVHGKVLLMLVNDPPVPDPADPSLPDPNTFDGRAMTYYGRWTYKLDLASQKGAAGAFIIHETEPAGYSFDVVRSSWGGERSNLAAPDKNSGRVAVEGWLQLDAARQVLALAGQDLDALKSRAATREFEPVPLGLSASISLHNTLRPMDSQNVLAKIEGSDPQLKSEYIVYTAHWDHLGRADSADGDGIYHGAVDNAVGAAGLLEIARAFSKLAKAPRRSILFLAPTAGEQGSLGSEYYVRAPVYPLDKTVAVINLETLNVHGRTRDITVIGLGASELDDYVREAAGEQGRIVSPDPEPEKGLYFRSDHFSFARRGVPALEVDKGIDFLGKPEGFGQDLRRYYVETVYHRPADVVGPDWDLAGAREDLTVLFATGYRVAEADRRPQWKPGREVRDTGGAAVSQ
jgi:Zn-dependent M28 family amino/carboxypeptidase